jgi:hypothetical protein
MISCAELHQMSVAVVRHLTGTYASVGMAASYFADYIYQAFPQELVE